MLALNLVHTNALRRHYPSNVDTLLLTSPPLQCIPLAKVPVSSALESHLPGNSEDLLYFRSACSSHQERMKKVQHALGTLCPAWMHKSMSYSVVTKHQRRGRTLARVRARSFEKHPRWESMSCWVTLPLLPALSGLGARPVLHSTWR